jgi:hypothetical protein
VPLLGLALLTLTLEGAMGGGVARTTLTWP